MKTLLARPVAILLLGVALGAEVVYACSGTSASGSISSVAPSG